MYNEADTLTLDEAYAIVNEEQAASPTRTTLAWLLVTEDDMRQAGVLA